MPTHPDAVGYLHDLAKEINEPWFKMVYDLAAVSGMSAVEDQLVEQPALGLFAELGWIAGL